MLARDEFPHFFRPRLVLADHNSVQAALTCRQFRRLGWEVHLARNGSEARRLARRLAPQVIILDTDLRDESGWLTCAKLLQKNPDNKVVLLADRVTDSMGDFAQFVGAAALVARAAGVRALVTEVSDTVNAA